MILILINFFLLMISQCKKNPIITMLIFVVFVIFWGAGYANGTDWVGYYSNYQCVQYDRCEAGVNFEFGYNLIVKFVGYFGFFFIVLFCALINTVSIIRFSKNFEKPYFFIFCIFSFYGWFLYIEQIRQALALSVLMVGIPSLYRRKLFIYILSVLVASQFHSSALFALLFIMPMVAKRLTPFFLAGTVIGALFVGIFSIDIFALILPLIPPGIVYEKLVFYNSAAAYSPKLSYGVGASTDVIIISAFLMASLRRGDTYEDRLSFFGTFVFIFILVAAKFQGVFIRLSYYAFPFMVVYFSTAMGRSDLKKCSLIKCVIYLYFITQIFRPFSHPVISNDIHRYESIFVHAQDTDDKHYEAEVKKTCGFADALGYGYLCGY